MAMPYRVHSSYVTMLSLHIKCHHTWIANIYTACITRYSLYSYKCTNNISAVSYTEKHPAVLQVTCGHINFACRDSYNIFWLNQLLRLAPQCCKHLFSKIIAWSNGYKSVLYGQLKGDFKQRKKSTLSKPVVSSHAKGVTKPVFNLVKFSVIVQWIYETAYQNMLLRIVTSTWRKAN